MNLRNLHEITGEKHDVELQLRGMGGGGSIQLEVINFYTEQNRGSTGSKDTLEYEWKIFEVQYCHSHYPGSSKDVLWEQNNFL